MIAYLIHSSLIWLIALLVYELWLRRTTFHGANRWYLSAALILGLLLPLYEPAAYKPVALPYFEQPLRALAVREQRLEVISRQAGREFNLMASLLGIAVAGSMFQLARLLREGLLLLRWRRHAVRIELEGRDVFVTGAAHGPFSAFGSVYISDLDAYADAELRFILAHEAAHVRLWHSLDKSFVLLLRCLFWWHPLIHLYYSRLMLVQEFQADQPLRREAPAYGRFLIEASLGGDGLRITHPFFHSPLKTRIRMLQRFATRNWQKAGYAAALTLIAAGSFLWTNKSIARKESRDGNTVTFNGNKFELAPAPLHFADGHTEKMPAGGIQIRFVDPPKSDPAARIVQHNGGTDTVSTFSDVPEGDKGAVFTVKSREMPVRMNGSTIYREEEVDAAAAPVDGGALLKLLIEKHMPSLAGLPDGSYVIGLNTVITDSRGKVVYYENPTVSWNVDMNEMPGTSFAEKGAAATREQEAHAPAPKLAKALTNEMEAALQTIRFSAATKGGKPVIAYLPLYGQDQHYTVQVTQGRVSAVRTVR